jgi:hypothetical protein
MPESGSIQRSELSAERLRRPHRALQGCVRTENAGATMVLLNTPVPACVCVKLPAPRPSKLPIVDGTDRVVVPGKLFVS